MNILGIKSSVPEELVFFNVAAEVAAEVILGVAADVHSLVLQQWVGVFRVNRHSLRSKIAIEGAVVSIPAALGQNIDDASQGLSVCGFEAAGFDLDFLN